MAFEPIDVPLFVNGCFNFKTSCAKNEIPLTPILLSGLELDIQINIEIVLRYIISLFYKKFRSSARHFFRNKFEMARSLTKKIPFQNHQLIFTIRTSDVLKDTRGNESACLFKGLYCTVGYL